MSKKKPVATTKTITVLRIDHHGYTEKGFPQFGIVDSEGRKYTTHPPASFAQALLPGDKLAGEDMVLHLNGRGVVVDAEWGLS